MTHPAEEIDPRVFTEIEELVQAEDVYDMLREGMAAIEVARFVKHTLQRLDGWSIEVVQNALLAKQKELVEFDNQPVQLEKLGANEIGRKAVVPHSYAKKLYGRAALSLDPMIEIAAAALSQRDRIALRMMEEDPAEPDESLYREFEEYRRLLESQVDFMEKFGIIGQGAHTAETSMDVAGARRKYGDRVARVLEDPQSRHKVLEAMRAVVALQLPESTDVN